MSLWDYRIFLSIVKEGNLRKAAEQLHLTPAAASHSLSKLEKEFGLPLFVRGRAGMELTQYGKVLLPHIRSTISADDGLHLELQRIKGRMNGLIRIGVINSTCCAGLPTILQKIREKMPDVRVNIYQGGYDELEDGLLEGTLDLAFVSMPTRKNLTAIPLMRDRLLCITPRDFVPVNGSYITVEEIKRFELIMPGPGSDFDAISFMREHDLDIKTAHSVQEDSSIVALVESGLGVSIMPELVLQKNRGEINIYPIESAPYRTIGVATLPESRLSSSVEETLNVIIDYVRSRYPTDKPYFRDFEQ